MNKTYYRIIAYYNSKLLFVYFLVLYLFPYWSVKNALQKDVYHPKTVIFQKCTLLVFGVFNKIFFHVNLWHCSHHKGMQIPRVIQRALHLDFTHKTYLLLASKGNSYFNILCPKLMLPNFISLKTFRYFFIIKFGLMWLRVHEK